MCFALIIMTIAVDSLYVCLSLSLSLSLCLSVSPALSLSLRPLSQPLLLLVTSAVFPLEKIPRLLCKNHHFYSNPNTYRRAGLCERLGDGESIVCAEGYLWELERRGYLSSGPFTPEVVLDQPERVTGLHEEFVACRK